MLRSGHPFLHENPSFHRRIARSYSILNFLFRSEMHHYPVLTMEAFRMTMDENYFLPSNFSPPAIPASRPILAFPITSAMVKLFPFFPPTQAAR